MKKSQLLFVVAGIITAFLATFVHAEEFAPYGTAKVDMHEYPTINAVMLTMKTLINLISCMLL